VNFASTARLGKKLVGLALLFSFVLSARATSVISPGFERLVANSDIIFTGQVLSKRSEWKDVRGRKSIVTLVSFGVRATHKGRTESTITLQFLGGTMGDVTLDVAEMPKFTPGERVVLFVEGNGTSASPLVGFYHGKFSLRQTAAGHDEMLTHNGKPLVSVRDIGRSTENRGRGISHDEFTARIRNLVARFGANSK
jgi:hypothetical protein